MLSLQPKIFIGSELSHGYVGNGGIDLPTEQFPKITQWEALVTDSHLVKMAILSIQCLYYLKTAGLLLMMWLKSMK